MGHANCNFSLPDDLMCGQLIAPPGSQPKAVSGNVTDDSYERKRFSVTAVAVSIYTPHGSLHCWARSFFPRVSMAEPQWVAMCCYRNRDVTWSRCTDCQSEYGCLGFGSSVEVLHFYELIPPRCWAHHCL
jgi:hypothetical protein